MTSHTFRISRVRFHFLDPCIRPVWLCSISLGAVWLVSVAVAQEIPDTPQVTDNAAAERPQIENALPTQPQPTAIQPLPSENAELAAGIELSREWEQTIRPLLATNCLECHSALEKSGQLEMETISSLLRGGVSGPAIDHQQANASLLLEVLAPEAPMHMPPKGQLTAAEIALIAKWLAKFANQPLPAAWQPTDANADPVPRGDGSTIVHSDQDDYWRALPLGLNPSLVIDMALETVWQSKQITPAPLADDSTFARRVYLDLVGRVPTESELTQFVASVDSRKREQLVDALLDSAEHATHLAEVLDAVLMGRKISGRGAKREHAEKTERADWLNYLTSTIRQNKPWNTVARDIILARPTSAEDRGAVWYLYARQNKHQDIAEAVSKDFFGVRIDCAQCHDHPLASEIEQRHYWGLVAFFNRSSNVDTPNGPRLAESAIGGFSEFTNLRGKSSQNHLVFLRAQPVEEARPAKDVKEEDHSELYLPAGDGEPKIPRFSRRQHFVDSVLDGNPLVAQAMVNRMWGWMYGRGLVHPVDALDSFHPASHPGLLDWLSRDFANSNYNVRRLLRHLALSRGYQLESKTAAAADPKWFASALAKPLTAESLYRSFQTALDVADPAVWNSLQQTSAFASLFPDVLAEESLANVAQGLWLTNGDSLQQLVSAEQSRTVQQVLQIEPTQQLVERLFRLILGRGPDDEELSHCVEYISARADQRQIAVESLTWAMITSAEFRFNH